MSTTPERIAELEHALSIVETERDQAQRALEDTQADRDVVLRQRDEADAALGAAREREAALLIASARLSDRIETFAQDAIVIVPGGDDPLVEAMRKRIRDLEIVNDRLRAQIPAPPDGGRTIAAWASDAAGLIAAMVEPVLEGDAEVPGLNERAEKLLTEAEDLGIIITNPILEEIEQQLTTQGA